MVVVAVSNGLILSMYREDTSSAHGANLRTIDQKAIVNKCPSFSEAPRLTVDFCCQILAATISGVSRKALIAKQRSTLWAAATIEARFIAVGQVV